jgi:hypothetical protein
MEFLYGASTRANAFEHCTIEENPRKKKPPFLSQYLSIAEGKSVMRRSGVMFQVWD